jgi:uncharacterized flavoprotein (TIGR03862 family)
MSTKVRTKPLPAAVAIVGGGPAGLMAAEILSRGGVQVDLYDAMPSVGRKFLMAGKGGMNITHSEPAATFYPRYGTQQHRIAPLLDIFGADAVQDWMHGLGFDAFIGSSGRVFPSDMKAAPLLRAWLQRLREAGVRFHMRHRCGGMAQNAEGRIQLHFSTPTGEQLIDADAVILALGGGSWAKLGSDGRWVNMLEQAGVAVAPLRPSNCGFDIGWSALFRERFAGQPVKPVVASLTDTSGVQHQRQGEFIITQSGVEGGLIYALSAPLREQIASNGTALLYLDLLPDYTLQRVIDEIAHPRGARSLSSHLQSRLGIRGVKSGLLHEFMATDDFADPHRLGAALKALPLPLIAPRPLDEAISSAGGVMFEALDKQLMTHQLPGVFCAGEMLDWEAPTGGYLLTACFATGHAAGRGALAWLQTTRRPC